MRVDGRSLLIHAESTEFIVFNEIYGTKLPEDTETSTTFYPDILKLPGKDHVLHLYI